MAHHCAPVPLAVAVPAEVKRGRAAMGAGAKELCGVVHKAQVSHVLANLTARPCPGSRSRRFCSAASAARRTGWTLACHARYGRIVRTSPLEVGVTEVDAVRAVLVLDEIPRRPCTGTSRVNRFASKLFKSVFKQGARVRAAKLHTPALMDAFTPLVEDPRE